MALEYIILFCGFIISEIMAGVLTMQENIAVEIIKVFIPAAVTFVGGLLIARKGKLEKNTQAIEKLIQQLGVNDDETLMHGLSSQYNNVMESIGRGGKASLTEQHAQMEKHIQDSYKTIESRYEKEDAAYVLFTAKQRDLAETMNNFTRDYKEAVSDRNRLIIENEKLREQVEILISEKKELSKSSQEQIKTLQEENKALRDKMKEREPSGRHGR